MLINALANPEHSEEARRILQALADERGLQSEAERGWAQTEESMYVAPFSRQPTFKAALAEKHETVVDAALSDHAGDIPESTDPPRSLPDFAGPGSGGSG